MKKLMYAVVFAAAALYSSAGFAGEVLKMGYFMLQPHTYSEGKDAPAKGAGIEYFNNVAAEMGYKVEWVGPLPLPRLTEYLREGKIDGTVGFPKFPVFEKFLYYPQQHVYMAQPSLGVSVKNSVAKVQSVNDIKGFRIGFVKSKSGRTTPMIDKNKAQVSMKELSGVGWMEQNLKKLDKGRLDALYDRQQYTMRYVAASLKLSDKVKVVPIADKASPMYVAISKSAPNDGKKLLEKLQQHLPKVKIDYVNLLEKEIAAVSK